MEPVRGVKMPNIVDPPVRWLRHVRGKGRQLPPCRGPDPLEGN